MKRKPKRKGPTLTEYAERFLAERDVSEIYIYQVRLRVLKLNEWAGRELLVSELTCELMNQWLADLLATPGLSPYTVNTYRANVLAVWNAAIMDGLNDCHPARLRRVKKPRRIIEAYSHAEIRQLLAEAARLKTKHPDGNRRADWWQAFIHAAYSTGLRRGDLLAIPAKRVSEDGQYATIMRKTGYRVTVKFSAETMRFAHQLQHTEGLLLPWPYRLDAMSWSFRRIRKRAGIDRGSIKWLRRSAGSYAESIQRGAGATLLGHRNESVFRNHYEDQDLTTSTAIEPPTIALSLPAVG